MQGKLGDELDDIEAQIIGHFGSREYRAHTQEIAEAIGASRHTASKYLSVLEARGLLGHDEVGNAKVWYPIEKAVDIRSLTVDDVDRILEIAQDIGETEDGGEEYVANLREELMQKFEDGQDEYCVGADAQGTLIGYMIGEERAWEFGQKEKAGWIRILGVAPEYQNKGVGKMLGEELLHRFTANDVERVRTMIDWDESDFLPFFHALGFDMKESTVLEKNLDNNE
ncbi:MAG: GNAT superfamily N-acetyltransferase [Haloarculaceae archaeon]|jgi:GNAT superfamily N-acetyltransferase